MPSWINVSFSDVQPVAAYSIRAGNASGYLDNAPRHWRMLYADYDTGTYATDTGKWTLADEQANQTNWSVSQKRTFNNDTGLTGPAKNWRLLVTNNNGDTEVIIAELQLLSTTDTGQVKFTTSGMKLNAGSRGALARARKRVVVSDTGTEHTLDINVSQGPVTIRVGTEEGDDDIISETPLGTGYHRLAFTPDQTYFHVTMQSDAEVNRVVSTLQIGDSGTLELMAPWANADLSSIRYSQSADVVFATAEGYQQRKIERRGTGRSWSIVRLEPDDGPFIPGRTARARLKVSDYRGNTTMLSDIPFFRQENVGSLFRLTHEGQDGEWYLGADEAATDVITVTGISDTGTPTPRNERRIVFTISGTYSGNIQIERSFDSPDYGFKRVTPNYVTTGQNADTGTFSCTVDDGDDNVTVFYRARMNTYTSGAAFVQVDYDNGNVTGIARVTSFSDSKEVDVEVLRQFSQTAYTDQWEEGSWSARRGYPTCVSLHEGRLIFAGSSSLWGSVSDDYENFDDLTEGDAAPLYKILGEGPVDNIYYLVSLLRLVMGTAGREISVKSSSLDEPLTPSNSSAKPFSTQGSADIRALAMDDHMVFVQRSKQRVFNVGFGGNQASAISDYSSREMTVLVPTLLRSGIRSVAIQRQPDTRLHCVLEDGSVAIMTYEPGEEVLAWSKWSTDTGTSSKVIEAAVLPGIEEDKVFYLIERTINGVKRRFIEKWAKESECWGDTGLSWLADCAVSYTDTGAKTVIDAFAPHLAGQDIVLWGNDTGQNNDYGRDLTFDTGSDQVLFTLDTGGDLTITDSGVKHLVGGLPYKANYRSSKLAYAAAAGTALMQMKRVDRLAFMLHKTHNLGIYYGNDTGQLDPMPRQIEDGSVVDKDRIYQNLDKLSMPFPGLWEEDSRIALQAKAPRPVTVVAFVPSISTNDKI